MKFLTSPKNLRYLVLAWLISLPFGANVLAWDIGFITLYPNLICTLLLAPITLLSFNKWASIFKWINVFYLTWLIVAVLVISFQNSLLKPTAIFDIRSLIMQYLFVSILFGVYHQFDKKEFKRIFIPGFRYFLGLLIIVAVFETYTGIHIQGNYTSKLLSEPIGNIYYASIFIYDNPNDFMVYCLGTFFILLMLDEDLRRKRWLVLCLSLILLSFSFFGAARLASFILLIFIAVQLLAVLMEHRVQIKKHWYYVCFGLLGLVILTANKDFFIGPIFQDKINPEKVIGEVVEEEMYLKKHLLGFSDDGEAIYKYDSCGYSDSWNVRKGLVLNGIDFIKEAPITGIGAGEFRARHLERNVRYCTHTNISPHCLSIELTSQYGIFGWLYFGGLTLLFFRLCILKWRKQLNNGWLLLMFPFYMIFSNMPSAFLYLDINWIFISLFLLIGIGEVKRAKVDGASR